MPSIKLLAAACMSLLVVANAMADDQDKPTKIAFGDGQFQLTAPASWQPQQPRTRIVEHEFTIPAAKGDDTEGRMTLMAAGGGVEANIERWYSQFTQPDGGSTAERAKLKKVKAAGHDVHLVDLSGTFKDQRGPMAPAVERPKYRMLGAIIAGEGGGAYFIKFYGPERTVAENEKAFATMIESLERK